MIFAVRHFPTYRNMIHHKILSKHIADIRVYLSDGIDISLFHTIPDKIPFTNAGP